MPGHDVNPITQMIVMSEGPRIAAEDDGEREPGHHQDQVGEAHEPGVDGAAPVAGHDADERPDR